MKRLFTLLLVLFPAAIYAQKDFSYILEYGKVSANELYETEYADDPEAEAAVIFDHGYYRFLPYETGNRKGLKLHMTFTSKIKIYNDAGLDYATIEIPY
jgi:hypothetical protein